MLMIDKEAIICDLAETYHIYNYKELPVKLLATLCVGLRDNSRIKMKINGNKVPYNIELIMAAVDRLSLLVYAQSKDAQKGKNKPKLLLEQLYENKSLSGYDSGEEFMKDLERIRKEHNHA